MFRIVSCAFGLVMVAVIGTATAQPPSQPGKQVAFMGVFGENITSDSGLSGAVIREVLADGPAAKAGLKIGDVVTHVDDHEVDGFRDLAATLSDKKPGEKVTVTVLREGKEEKIEVELGGRPAVRMTPAVPFEFGPRGPEFRLPDGRPFPFQFPEGGFTVEKRPMIGIEMQQLDDDLKQQLKLDDQQGVVIANVLPGSPAEKAGLQSTDLITEADGKAVTSPEELTGIVAEKKAGDTLALKILRDGKAEEKSITVEEMAPRPSGRFNFPEGGRRGQQFQRYFTPDDRIPQLESRIGKLEEEVKANDARLEQLEKQLEELKTRVGKIGKSP